MPYIKQADREALAGGSKAIWTPGELNYAFTVIINKYIADKKLSYQTINDVIGALEGAKIEFYRRKAVDYEIQKIVENGDVY